jgi:hypothetical protein
MIMYLISKEINSIIKYFQNNIKFVMMTHSTRIYMVVYISYLD